MTPEVLHQRLEGLHEDVSEIKQAMNKVTEAIVSLARIEERQAQTSAAMDRAFAAISKLENRMISVEKAASDPKRIAGWVDRVVTGAIVVLCLYILKHVGIV